MFKRFQLIAGAGLLFLCACGSDYGTKQTVGTLAGAGLGGLAGASLFDGKGQLAATAAGTLVGAYLGNEAGKSLDRADAVYERRAATTGSAKPWRNPDTGSYGAVTPMRTYE